MRFCFSFHLKPNFFPPPHTQFHSINFPLLGTPGYVPPISNFDGESTDGIALSFTVPANKAKKGNF